MVTRAMVLGASLLAAGSALPQLVARIAGDVEGWQIDAEYRLGSVPCAGWR